MSQRTATGRDYSFIFSLQIGQIVLMLVVVARVTWDDNKADHRNVAIDVSPQGESVVFASADGDLYLFVLKTSAVRQLTKTDAIETTPCFSPDGTQIAYAAEDKGAKESYIVSRSLDGKQVRQLTKGPGISDYAPSFSADGKYIAFARAHRYRPYSMGGWVWDDWDVYIMDADGTNQRRITNQTYYLLNRPCFSPDGKTIIYSAQLHGIKTNPHTMYTVDVSGNSPPKSMLKEVPKSDTAASQTTLSPDGNRIAFVSDRAKAFQYDVLIMNRDGTQQKALGVTSVSEYNQSPLFMPDGKSVMFLAGTEWNIYSRPIYSLWTITCEGKDLKQIADSGLFTDPHNWKRRR